MSMLANVKKGRIIRPVLLTVYGPGGIGKSTFGAGAPNPIFLGAEEGTDLLDVARLPTPRTYEDVKEALRELLEVPHDYKTLVVDSLDWIEPLIFNFICRRYGKPSIEQCAGGYGKGYIEAADEWVKLIGKFSHLRDKRGMNIILIAHPEVKNVTNPQTQATYQRYELKLHKLSKNKIMEYVDAIFFASFELYTEKVGEDIKTIATQNRVLHTVPSQYDAFDAKNRYGLIETIPLNMPWNEFLSHCNINPTSVAEITGEIESLTAEIVHGDIRDRIKAATLKASTDLPQLIKIRDHIKTLPKDLTQ